MDEEDGLEAMEEFVSGPLVIWMQTLEELVGRSPDQLPQGEEEANEYFRKLVNGDFLHQIMQTIDQIPRGPPTPWKGDNREEEGLHMLQIVLQRLQNFYRDELHQVILSPPPNLHVMVREPFTAQAVQEMKKLVQLLLGSAVQCEQRDVFIGRIQSLDISVQAALASAIKEVSQEPENVLGLQWREMDPSSLQQLLWDLGARVQKLVAERDAGLEQLWELQQKQGAPLVAQLESNQSHLGVQLAERQAHVRRLQGELERKMEELLDQQEETRNLEQQLRKIQQENRTLAGEARQARLYQDELDALREKAFRAERLQSELTALRERIPALERCRAQLKEERDFSKALLEAKAMMEEELDTVYARGLRLSQAEKENLRLQNHLNQIQEERDQLSDQSEELLRENLLLKKQLQETLTNSPRESWSKYSHLDADEFPEMPHLLDCEMKEANRMPVLEKENRERRRIQLLLGSKNMEAELKDGNLDGLPERRPSQAEEQNSDIQEHKPEILAYRKTETAEGRAPEQESETSASEMKATLSIAQARLREAEQAREAESRHAASLEETLRSIQGAYGEAQEECERWRAETGRLVEEIQALQREKETLKAGSRVLQEAATQAEVDLNQAQQNLQKERLRGAQLAQKLQGTENDLGEAQHELQNLQRSVEQHRVTLAQMEVEKGALEEALSQAESGRRQADKDGWRLKAKTQAQEAALAEQGRHLALLEAQTRRQAAELTSLQEVLQSLGELEQENANLRKRLEDKENAAAMLEQELAREKAGPSKDNAAESQDHPPKEQRNPEPETDSSQAKARNSCKGQPESALIGRFEELHRPKEPQVQTQEAVLQVENSALTGRLTQLESLASSLETVLSGLTRQKAEDKEGNGKLPPQNSTSQRSLLVRQLSEVRQRSGRHEAEVQTVRLEAEGWRRRYEQLRLDHDRLMLLHRQQGDELERTLNEQAVLKAALRGLEKEQRELEGRHNQLLGQKTSLELQEVALLAQKERLELAERRHQDLAEQYANLKEEKERIQRALVQSERAYDDLQGELQGMQNRLTGVQLEQAKLEAENVTLKEQNQQLDTALGRLSTQCELLVQLKGKQEEENRHLLLEIQLLSRENRQLLERSMENREHFQEEQRQYQDKLGELRREKQKLVEKIMDQYRVLEPAIPRGKKSNWIAGKIRRLMKLRREQQPRPMAEGAGSSNESLAGPEEHGLERRVSSTPSSPSLLRKASSNISLPESPPVHFRHCRLSSRLPLTEPSGSGDEEGQDTPRQRFRQRRLGVLWGSLEDPAVPEGESEPTSQLSTTSEEKRGQPPGEEDQTSNCLL
ncbi:coiled-coil domain-containing protein 88B [Ahaetulla prasina]|uniref:coiled-coil domain-containing protein 88B n=1 Tax=Ahaetulla prasina TaxID=499056 RepID=UPI00264A1A30|nr:coiled-coil domain-containing protein 88B [Ahaetulla prasina]